MKGKKFEIRTNTSKAELVRSVRRSMPPPTKWIPDKKKYSRKNKHNKRNLN